MLGQFILIFLYFHFAIGVCPNGSLEWQSNCLLFNSNETGFGDAEITCRISDGHLSSVHDGFTNVILGQEALKYFNQSSVVDFWIGANTLISKTWAWTDDTSFDYFEWKQGEPLNVTGTNCVALSTTDGYWIAQDCFKFKPFVCAIPNSLISTPIISPTTTSTTTTTTVASTTTFPSVFNCSDGWDYFQPTNSCYGVPESFLNWNASEKNCQTYGAHLASVHSEAEFQFINNKAVMPNCHSVWLGLHSDDNLNTWKWTDNTPFDYAKWGDGLPSNDASDLCVLIDGGCNKDDYFHNLPCSHPYVSICKKPYNAE